MKNKSKSKKQKDEPPTEPTFLEAPSNLRTFDVVGNQVVLQWDAQTEGEESFELHRFRVDTLQLDQVHEPLANTTEYIDTTVEPETTYLYVLRARLGDQPHLVSGFSNPLFVVTPSL
jgi:hypothetical protein